MLLCCHATRPSSSYHQRSSKFGYPTSQNVCSFSVRRRVVLSCIIVSFGCDNISPPQFPSVVFLSRSLLFILLLLNAIDHQEEQQPLNKCNNILINPLNPLHRIDFTNDPAGAAAPAMNKPANLANSAVLRMLEEQEEQRRQGNDPGEFRSFIRCEK